MNYSGNKVWNIKTEIKQALIIFLAGTAVEWLVIYLTGSIVPDEDEARLIIMLGSFWVLLWKGSEYLSCLIDTFGINWKDQPIRRFFITLTIILIYIGFVSLVVPSLFFVVFGAHTQQWVWQHMDLANYLQVLGVTLAINTFMHGRAFLFEWRQAAIDNEKLKTESISSKFESLRNQVNPHFLFNSLNALSALIYTDQDKAAAFVEKLSDVYRYVIDHQNDEVVALETELDFLKAYVYLVSIRYGKNLTVQLECSEDENTTYIPPVSLQLLVENCIKHNEISGQNPLKIGVKQEGDYILVTNNLNPLLHPKKDSNKLGLSNIIERYQILTDDKVVIQKSEHAFEVKLPLLKMKKN